MFEILEKTPLSADVMRYRVTAPLIAQRRHAGQFVLVQLDAEYGERIPLTIADADAKMGWITLVVQTVGATTYQLAQKEVGETLAAVLGPLGNPTHIQKGNVVCVGGGIGAAPLHPIVQAHRAAGSHITTIIGARSKDLLVYKDDLASLSDTLIVMTDDGSAGVKGLVTMPLKELCTHSPPPDEVIAIGPPVMMQFCCETTKEFNVPTVVSLNTIMIDGTGMCGGCRVSVGGETKFVCVDGPEFDGHAVDFANMRQRLATFKTAETERFHRCKLQGN